MKVKLDENLPQDLKRLLLSTFDTDFTDIRHYPPGSHNGIVVFRLKDQRWTAMKGPVRQFIDSGGLEKLQDGLAIVQESSTRYRRA